MGLPDRGELGINKQNRYKNKVSIDTKAEIQILKILSKRIFLCGWGKEALTYSYQLTGLSGRARAPLFPGY